MTHHVRLATRISTAVVLVLSLVGRPLCAVASDQYPPARMTYQSFLVDANGVALGNTAPKNYDVVFRIYNDQNNGALLWSEQQTAKVDKGYFSVLLGEGSQVNAEPHGALGTLFIGADISDRYVEMTVKGIGSGGADVIIKPRLRLMTAPYAFSAQNALYAANLVNSSNGAVVNVSGSFVGINKLVPAAALDVTGNASVSGTVSANSLSASSATLSGALTANALNATTASISGTVSAGTFAGNGTIPLGGIIMWSGATNAVPTGWALCNGQTVNGRTTPNLVDRFVIGAGATYAVNSAGGSKTVTLTADQLPPHQHNYKDSYHIEESGYGSMPHDVVASQSGTSGYDNGNTWLWYTWHWTELTPNAAAGTPPASYVAMVSNPVPTMPPYYALAYIMRVQ